MRRISFAEVGGRGGFVPDQRYGAVATGQCPRDPSAEAYDRGFADGKRAGEERAAAGQASHDAERGAIELAFARFDDASAAVLRDRLHDTVLFICQQMAGPIALDVARLAARVEDAAALMQRRHDERLIRLHPEDLALVDGRVRPDLALQADPTLERGALRIDDPDGGIEDGAEQWRLALAEALGECSL